MINGCGKVNRREKGLIEVEDEGGVGKYVVPHEVYRNAEMDRATIRGAVEFTVKERLSSVVSFEQPEAVLNITEEAKRIRWWEE